MYTLVHDQRGLATLLDSASIAFVEIAARNYWRSQRREEPLTDAHVSLEAPEPEPSRAPTRHNGSVTANYSHQPSPHLR